MFENEICKFGRNLPLATFGSERVNLCVQKNETCNYSRDFLLALQSSYLPPNIDKPTRVHKNSASLTDNIFVNNPEQVLISGNLITDVSDHFSQFCTLTSTRDNIGTLNVHELF